MPETTEQGSHTVSVQPAPRPEGRRTTDLRWTLAGGVAVLALVIAMVGMFLPPGGDGGGSTGADLPAKTIDVRLSEMKIEPASVTVKAGQKVIFNVTNVGSMQHDFKVNGTDGTKLLNRGQKATVTIGPLDASTQAWCTVAGHKAAGMVMDIKVEGASTGAGSSGDTTATTAASTSFAKIDKNAEPADGWKPFDPTLKPAPGGTTHNVELHAIDKDIEVAPGVTQKMWTFGGTVPGTTLRGNIGDVFNITLYNDGTINHSIDFHASKVAWNDEMRDIAPGEHRVYQFKAKYAGAFMYHCGTSPTLHHIGNGMFGAIIINPPNLPPVDHEYLFVQSELYLGPQGAEGDLDKMLAVNFDAVVFNGYWNQYKFAPIRVEPNQRIRTWVVDDGPSENSAFHIVGTVFDTVWREGAYQLRPDDTHGGSQVLDLQPAQGGFVEFTFDEGGLYPIVTHKFSNASKGALGLFQAGEVAAVPAGGH